MKRRNVEREKENASQPTEGTRERDGKGDGKDQRLGWFVEKRRVGKDFVGALDKFSAIGSFDADSPSASTHLRPNRRPSRSCDTSRTRGRDRDEETTKKDSRKRARNGCFEGGSVEMAKERRRRKNDENVSSS